MNRFVVCAIVAMGAPMGVSAATIATQGGGPYDISSDTLFTGIVVSESDGAGSYVLDFFTSGEEVKAIAEAAVTAATVNISFANLTMSWIDGLSNNTLVSSAGVDTLTTVFNAAYPIQQLSFDWTNSDAGAGFRFDVATNVAPIPLPASILLFGSALAGLGAINRRKRTTKNKNA